jgi:hypothetical protein
MHALDSPFVYLCTHACKNHVHIILSVSYSFNLHKFYVMHYDLQEAVYNSGIQPGVREDILGGT